MLFHIAQNSRVGQMNFTIVSRLVPGQSFEKRSFSRSVYADKADAVIFLYFKGDA